MIDRTPRFVWNDGVVIHDETFALPVARWASSFPTIGGEIESDAGHPASYVVRRPRLLVVPVRYLEEEWPTIRALIEYGQTGGTFMWYPSADNEDESYEVILDAPALGDDVSPDIDRQYPRASSIALTLRRDDDSSWDGLEYFTEAA